MIVFSIFVLFPMVFNFIYTFTGSDKLFLDQRPYVGAANLERLFDCGDFLRPATCDEDLFAAAVLNTGGFVVTQVAVMIAVSLLTAVVLNGRIRARGFFRSVFFYPVLLSPIVVAMIWRWMLQENGLFNAVIVGMGGEKLRFLTDRNWARFWVVMVSVWSLMGFYTLILLAGLQAIPADLYEAAAIDGASGWNAFRSITLPLLAPTMLVVIVLSTIRAVQIFDVVFAFTGGGPGSATLYIVHYIYNNGFASPLPRIWLGGRDLAGHGWRADCADDHSASRAGHGLGRRKRRRNAACGRRRRGSPRIVAEPQTNAAESAAGAAAGLD